MADYSPMMKQYFEVKEKYPNTILFFRLGDFYEMFFEDEECDCDECGGCDAAETAEELDKLDAEIEAEIEAEISAESLTSLDAE